MCYLIELCNITEAAHSDITASRIIHAQLLQKQHKTKEALQLLETVKKIW